MTANREFDIQVARALGLDVLGDTWAVQDPESCNYWYPVEDYKYASMEPVYLEECVCHLYNDEDNSDLIPAKTLGHHLACLQVVKFYSANITQAWPLLKILHNKGWRITLMDENDADIFSVEATLHKCPECHRGDGHALAYAKSFDDYPRAICEVFVKAKQEEFKDRVTYEQPEKERLEGMRGKDEEK